MSVTGSGTQADPYIITTIDELFTYAAMEGVYILVNDDVNVPSSNAYARGVDRPLVLRCAYLAGKSTGKRTKVKGLTVGQGASYWIKSEVASGSTCTVERLEFTGGVFSRKRDGTGADLLLTDCVLNNCGFSYECRQADKTGAAALSGGALDSCYVYINGTQPMETVTPQIHNVLFRPDSAAGCNFEAHGMHIYSADNALPVVSNGFKCLYYLADCTLYHDEDHAVYIAGSCDTCALAISQKKGDSTALTVDDRTAAFTSMSGVNIIDSEFWSSVETGGFTLPVAGAVTGLYPLKTEQMKSRGYLHDIGFLP